MSMVYFTKNQYFADFPVTPIIFEATGRYLRSGNPLEHLLFLDKLMCIIALLTPFQSPYPPPLLRPQSQLFHQKPKE